MSRCDCARPRRVLCTFKQDDAVMVHQTGTANASFSVRRSVLPRDSVEPWARSKFAQPKRPMDGVSRPQVHAPHWRRNKDASAMPGAAPHEREARCNAASAYSARTMVLLISLYIQIDLVLRAHLLLRGRVKTARCASRNILPVLSARHVASGGALHERRGC